MKFARIITRLQELIASRIRYKITRGGMLFTAAIVIVGAAAVFTGDNPLFLIVAAMMATLLVSGFVSRLVPGRARARFHCAGARGRHARRARTALRAQPQMVHAIVFHARDRRSGARKPHAGIERLLPADRGRR